jgi:hypothetical protein
MSKWTCAIFGLMIGATALAQQTLVKKNPSEKGYAFRNAAVNLPVWTGKAYAISALPASLKGTQVLVRPADAGRDFPDPREYTATADCTAYLAVRNEFNKQTEFPEAQAKQLIDAGWSEVDEVFKVAAKGENWKWRLFKKDILEGKIDLRPGEMKLQAMTVFFFGKRRD